MEWELETVSFRLTLLNPTTCCLSDLTIGMEEAEASTDQSSCKVVVDEPVGSESREVEDKEPKPVRKPGEAAIKSQ